MGDDGITAAIRDSGPSLGFVVALASIVISVITAIIRGWLIPDRHHREIVDRYQREIDYRDRQIDEITDDRDWWREQAVSGTHISDRLADIATQRRLGKGRTRAGGDEHVA